MIKMGNVFYTPKYFIFSVMAAVIVYPILLLIVVPLLLYRFVIDNLARIRDPKLGPMLTGINSVLAGSEPYNKPISVIGPYFPFNEKLDRDHILKVIQDKVISPGYYPNLKQKVVSIYSYNFWRDEDNFNVGDHVRYFNPEDPDKPVTLAEFREWAVENVGKMRFDPEKSPWEWILIPNFIDKNNPSVKSLAMMRINHFLMDGYSEVKFGQKISSNPHKWTVPGEDDSRSKPSKPFKTLMGEWAKLLSLLVTGPYHVIEFLFGTNDNSEILMSALQESRKFNEFAWRVKMEEPSPIPKVKLTQIKTLHGVSMTAVITTLVAMATGKYLYERFGRVPKKMVMLSSFPLPGHPDAMCNHWTAVRLPIRVHLNDPMKTLKNIHREYEIVRNSPSPLTNFYLFKLIGMLPICLHPNMENVATQTIVLTNFPGPHTETADMFGYEYESVNSTGSPAYGSGFIFATVCMGGMFRFDVAGLGTLVRTQEDINSLVNSVTSILNQLEN